jgi:hypothetical protein
MLPVTLGLFALVGAAVLYGGIHWQSGTEELRDRLEAGRLPIEPKVFDRRELEHVPAPVQRYFSAVLQDRQPVVAAVRVEHKGTFNIGQEEERWKPFTSTQRVITRRAGFDWDARVAMMPGLRMHVHDAYVAGEGILHAAVLGLVPMVNLHGTDEMAKGELMRFLAEAVWYPTALLPSQGVLWDAVDAHSARATLKDGDITVTLLFHFNEEGLIHTVRAEARGRTVSGIVVPTPWRGRFWNYATEGGMRVPLDGEVAWLLPAGARPYWRGRITQLSYRFAQ